MVIDELVHLLVYRESTETFVAPLNEPVSKHISLQARRQENVQTKLITLKSRLDLDISRFKIHHILRNLTCRLKNEIFMIKMLYFVSYVYGRKRDIKIN